MLVRLTSTNGCFLEKQPSYELPGAELLVSLSCHSSFSPPTGERCERDVEGGHWSSVKLVGMGSGQVL